MFGFNTHKLNNRLVNNYLYYTLKEQKPEMIFELY